MLTEPVKGNIRAIEASLDRGDQLDVMERMKVLSTQLEKFDAADFAPAAQADFIHVQNALKPWTKKATFRGDEDIKKAREICAKAMTALDSYGGARSGAERRAFPFVSDADLRSIVERDYEELTGKLMPAGAWKSAVIMAGSILEAILYDQLTRDLGRKQQAMSDRSAPKHSAPPGQPRGSGQPKDPTVDDWKLQELITVATNIGVLPAERAKAIDQVLRDYRNFVHPRREIRAQHSCTEAEAKMAVGALEAVCNHLK